MSVPFSIRTEKGAQIRHQPSRPSCLPLVVWSRIGSLVVGGQRSIHLKQGTHMNVNSEPLVNGPLRMSANKNILICGTVLCSVTRGPAELEFAPSKRDSLLSKERTSDEIPFLPLTFEWEGT